MSTARRLTGLLLTFLLALAVTACGDSGEDLSAGEGDQGAAEEQAPGELLQARMLETAGTPSAFIAYGVQEGFFEEEGLDLQMEPSQGGAAAIPALTSGDVDIAGSNIVSALIAISRGLPVRMVTAGSSAADDPEQDFSAVLVAPDSPINAPEDLAGTRVAVNTLQNINDVVLFAALDKRGLDPSSVELVEMPFPDMLPAIERGEVDAGMLIEPFVTVGMAQGMRPVLRQYSDMRPGLQIGTMLMTEEQIAQEPELVEAFQAGVQRTADAITEDPEAFREALPEIAEFDPALAPEIHLPQWRGSTDMESIELIAAAMEQFGMLEGEVDLEEVVLR